MSIVYQCRHCGHKIGEIASNAIDFSALGINELTAEEKEQYVHYEEDGTVRIHAICDSCKQTLKERPEYHELDFFIQ